MPHKKQVPAAPPGVRPATSQLTDQEVSQLLALPTDAGLRSKLRSKHLSPSRFVKEGTVFSKSTWVTPDHEGFPVPVLAAAAGAAQLQTVLVSGGDSNASTACGFNAVMSALMSGTLKNEQKAAVLQVRAELPDASGSACKHMPMCRLHACSTQFSQQPSIESLVQVSACYDEGLGREHTCKQALLHHCRSPVGRHRVQCLQVLQRCQLPQLHAPRIPRLGSKGSHANNT